MSSQLSLQAQMTFQALSAHSTQRALAIELGRSVRQVQRYLAELERAEWITITREGRENQYIPQKPFAQPAEVEYDAPYIDTHPTGNVEFEVYTDDTNDDQYTTSMSPMSPIVSRIPVLVGLDSRARKSLILESNSTRGDSKKDSSAHPAQNDPPVIPSAPKMPGSLGRRAIQSDEDRPPPHELETILAQAVRAKRLTPPMAKRLTQPVQASPEPGEALASYPSPVQYWDDDNATWRKWVQLRCNQATQYHWNKSKLVNAVCNYPKWLEFQAKYGSSSKKRASAQNTVVVQLPTRE